MRTSRALFAVLTNENRFFCIHVYNRRAVLQNFGMLVPIEKRRHEVYVPKVLQEGSESDDGQDVQSVSDKEEQSVDAFENDPERICARSVTGKRLRLERED